MKKTIAIISVILLAGSMFLSSCNSNKRACPAYPPSTYSADTETPQMNLQVSELDNNEKL